MTNQICVSNNPESKIYALAKRSEDFIQEKQTTLLAAPGTTFQLFFIESARRFTTCPVVEAKTLPSGYTSLKIILEDGDVICLNESNFNKINQPVRTFTDRFLLRKEKDSRDLVRVYSTDGHAVAGVMPVGAGDTLARIAARSLFEHLVGKENIVAQVNPAAKMTVQLKPTKAVTGSFYHSVLYRFNAIGDCEALAVKDIAKLSPTDIVIRYSFSKNCMFIYLGENTIHDGEEFLKNLELSGQEDFYIKPELRATSMVYGYVEPVIKLK